MPFKSESQRRFMFMHYPEIADEFEKHTPKGKKLPYHVAQRVARAKQRSKSYK